LIYFQSNLKPNKQNPKTNGWLGSLIRR